MIDNLMRYAKLDYSAAKAIINYGGVFLVFAAAGFTIIQILFFYILYDSYNSIKEFQILKSVNYVMKDIEKKLELRNGKNSFPLREIPVMEEDEGEGSQIDQNVDHATMVTVI